MRQNQLPEGTIGFIVGLLSVGALLARVGLGWAIDRFGARIFLLIGSLLWAGTSILISWAVSPPILILCRLAQGVGLGLFSISAVIYASFAIQPSHRGKVVGIVETISAIAISISPVSAMKLVEIGGYQLAFIIASLVPFLGFLLTLFLPFDTPGSNQNSPQFKGKIKELTYATLLPGIIGAAFFAAGSAFVGLLPLMGARYQVENIGLMVSLRGLGTIPTRLSSGFISDHRGYPAVIIPGYIMGIVAVLWAPLIKDNITPYLLSLLFGLGMGFVSPTISSWTMSRVPSEIRATAVSMYVTIAEFAGFLGTWFIGLSLETNSLNGFYLLGLIQILGLLFYIFSTILNKKTEVMEKSYGKPYR